MSEPNQDAQHPATAIRLQQANQDGDAPRSYELIAALQLTTGIVIIQLLVSGLASQFSSFATQVWQPVGITDNSVTSSIQQAHEKLTSSFLTTLLPILAAILICSILSHAVQSPSAFGFKKPLWQPQQLNPLNGMKKLLSMDNLVRGVLGIPKVAIVVLVTLIFVWNQRFEFAELQQGNTNELGTKLASQIFMIALAASGTLLAVSVFDYVIQWYSFHSRIRMTDQQLRDENRLQSPDPQVKSRRLELFNSINSIE